MSYYEQIAFVFIYSLRNVPTFSKLGLKKPASWINIKIVYLLGAALNKMNRNKKWDALWKSF